MPSATGEAGSVTIKVTEAEVNQAIQAQLQSQPESIITEPKVTLQKDQVTLTGVLNLGSLQANIVLLMQAQVNPEGQPEVSIASAQINGSPLPESMKQNLAEFANQMISSSLSTYISDYRLTSINVNEGFVTITGVKK